MESAVDRRRSRKVYVLWGIALTLLLTAGLFCWLVVVPALRARAAIMGILDNDPDAEEHRREDLASLGGPQRAATSISLYLRWPKVPVEHRGKATLILAHCGPAAVPALLRLTRDRDWLVRHAAA